MTNAALTLGSDGRVAQLSPREMQVALLSAEGASIAELARDLGIGTGTVMSIRRHIRNKLGLTRDESLDSSLLEIISRLGTTTMPAREGPRPGGAPAGPPSAQATLARRRYLVLRQAISELERTGERIRERAAAMARMASEMDDPGQAWQLEQLNSLAEGLAHFTEEFIASVRNRSPD
ncbi:MAG: response regulator transcription factor [Acidimicrobiales bacterium]